MNFTVERKKTYAIITMNADTLNNHVVAELRSEIVLLSGSSVKNIILDLSKCESCDTAGLGAIQIAHRLCKDGKLILVGVKENVENMFRIQHFDPALVYVNDMAEAEVKMQE